MRRPLSLMECSSPRWAPADWALAASWKFWKVGKGRGPHSGHRQGGKRGQVPAVPRKDSSRWPRGSRCRALHGGPHAVTKTHHPHSSSQDTWLSGRVALSRKETGPEVTLLDLGPRSLGCPSPHPLRTRQAPAHLLPEVLELQHQLTHLMPGGHQLLCFLFPEGDSEDVC